MFPLAYRLLTRLALFAPMPRGKLATSIHGRRAAAARWIEWASSHRTTQPLIWVHGASVGESLTAIPVIERLRTRIPGVQIAHSFSSPSFVSWGSEIPADRSDYLPLGGSNTLASVLDVMSPSILVCSRGDLWPETAFAASARELPIAIISGSVRPRSRRLWYPIRRAFLSVHRSVSWLGAASEGDASRWSRLGVREDSIEVTGDTRHDQVLERVTRLQPIRFLFQWAHNSSVLVAGSTDSRDEQHILKAFSRVSAANSNARLVIAPHECSGRRLDELLGIARNVDVGVEVWSGGSPNPETRCIVMSKMGVLADAYALGKIAYVGGGFYRGGLHAVIEPAALAVPVLIGPCHQNSTDAELLVDAGGATALPVRSPEDLLTRTWLEWIKQDNARTDAGLRARRVLQQGAADATITGLLGLLPHDRSYAGGTRNKRGAHK